MVPKGGNFHNELSVPPPSTFSSFLHLSVLMCMCTQHDSSNSIPYRGLFSLGFNFHYVAKMLKLILLKVIHNTYLLEKHYQT